MTIKEEQKDKRVKKDKYRFWWTVSLKLFLEKDNFPFFNQALALSSSRGATFSLNKQNKADYWQIPFIYFL